jgi:hypothetical protein
MVYNDQSKLTVGEDRHIQLLDSPLHRLPIRECLDEDCVDTNLLELLCAGNCFVPSVDKSVGSCEDEDVFSFITGVDGRLDTSVGLFPGDNRLALCVTAACDTMSGIICFRMRKGERYLGLTLGPGLVLNHNAGSTSMGKTLNSASDVERASVSSITISHDGDSSKAYSLLDLVAHLRHGNVASVRQPIGAGHRVPAEKDDWESGLLNKAGGQTIVAARVTDDLVGVLRSLEHHGTQTAGLG